MLFFSKHVSRSELPDLTNLSGPPKISALASETTKSAKRENILHVYDKQQIRALQWSTVLICLVEKNGFFIS